MKFVEFLKKKWYIALIAVVLIAVGVFAAISLLSGHTENAVADDDQEQTVDEEIPAERIRLGLTALDSDKAGVRTESGFKLSFPKGTKLDSNMVQESLKITPSFDYSLENAADGLIIKPKAFLQPNMVYTFSLDLPNKNIQESWAFQTRREFKIVSTLPGQKGTGVPVNSGIEITFSHADIENFGENFSIEPNVKGRFEIHKNIGVFVPEKLEKDTIYTVTVKKGVSHGGTGETLKDDYSFSFQTETASQTTQNISYLYFYDYFYNFPTDIQPVFEIGSSEDYKDKNADISVYRYESVDDFLKEYEKTNEAPDWVVYDRASNKPDVSAMTPFKTYNLPFTYVDEYYYMSYLSLPENLPEGYYVVFMKSGNIEDYTFVQINDMQLYLSIGKNKSLIWANDMITGQPVSNASFEGNGIAPVTTGEDGTAVIGEDIYKDKTGRTICFKLTRDGHLPLVAPIYNGGSYYNSADANYDYKSNWSYMYLDRNTYLPTDIVKVWGLIRPRSGETPPQTLTVSLTKQLYDYTTYESTTQILDTKEVTLNSKGVYQAQFSFEDLPQDYYQIRVSSGNVMLETQSFNVERYVKSDYVLSIKPENKVYFSGETFKGEVGCEFFEGTPVPGFGVTYSVYNTDAYESIHEGKVKLDEQGKAELKLSIPEITNPASWEPQYHRIYVSNTNPEDSEVSDISYFTVFPRDVMVDITEKVENGTGQLHFETSNIDLSKVCETGEFYDGGNDPLYKGAAVDKNLKVTLYERYWDSKETGQYYDMISKQSYKTYEFFEVKNQLQSFEVNTVNGVADYSLSISGFDKNKSYYIVTETSDNSNRPIQMTRYLYGYEDYWYGYGYGNGENYYYLEFDKDEPVYKTDESINFSIKKNNHESVSGGAILYMVLQEGIKDYWVSESPEQTKPFDESYIPNAFIQAVYFDGKRLYTAYDRMVSYDSTEKSLSIELKTDQESYNPGDTVNAEVSVKDADGNPCEATINLSVVDEAYFALYSQYVDTLRTIYRSVYSPGMVSSYISYREIRRPSGGAEGGEGEDEGGRTTVRKNFVDNAYFDSIDTDNQGKAQISFKLPDNLTSWRMTYQAVTDNLKAGNGQKNINTRLPFFVKLLVNDTYLADDSPVILIKGYGAGVDSDDKASFKLTLKGPDGEETFSSEGTVGNFSEIKLPNLKEGNYTLTCEGKSGAFSDAVEKTVEVRKSLLIAPKLDYYTMYDGLKLKNPEGYSTITFYNAKLQDYYRTLLDLYWSWGNRLDQVLARNVAVKLLNEHFDWNARVNEADVSPFQKTDGGFSILSYGSSDVELSAKVAALCSSQVNTPALKGYFWSIVRDPSKTPLEVAAAYWGLASLREPILLDIQAFIEEGEMMTDEKLYLANALAEIGDLAGAEKIYSDITSSYSKSIEPYKYIDKKGDRDEIQRLTSLTAMLAVKINAEDKMAYFGYIENNSTDEILINLERLILAKQGLPYVTKNSSFELMLDGKKETINLEGVGTKKIMLSPEKYKTLKFAKVKGDVAVTVSYEGASDPADTQNTIASIKRTYNQSSASPVEIGRTDMIKIDLSIKFDSASPEGYYEITDVLPAGLRYIYPYQANADEWYYGEPDGQRVKLGCYHAGGEGLKNISYMARVSEPGQFTADSAIIKHSESSACGYSKRTQVLIK